MSAVDYPALLAQLEQQRAAATQEIADLDVIIAAVRKRAAPQVPVGLTLPPARNGTKRTAKRPTAKTRGNPHDPKWAQARADYAAGKPVAQIAKAAGCSVATLYTRASEGKWTRPKGDQMPAAVAPSPKGTQLSGSVKCTAPDCGVMTDYDPCRRCGTPLKRKW